MEGGRPSPKRAEGKACHVLPANHRSLQLKFIDFVASAASFTESETQIL